MADERFRHMYAKAIADTLRAKEEEEAKELKRIQSGNRTSTVEETKNWERAKVTYSELCHDDPIISGGNDDCRRLARALAPRQGGGRKDGKRLGLCTRLVDGLLQAVARAESNVTSSATRSQNIEEQADNLTTASSFLGSFEPPEGALQSNHLSNEDKSRLVEEATASIVNGMEKIAMESEKKKAEKHVSIEKYDDANSSSSSDFFVHNKNGQNPRNEIKDDDSMEEVFAEESDPDDYEYESSYHHYSINHSDTTSNINNSAKDCIKMDDVSSHSGFDVLVLSKPSKMNETWHGARKAIFYLLSNLSYGKLLLSSLSSRTWLDIGASDTLADFSFMLLLHHSNCCVEGRGIAKKDCLLIGPTCESGDVDDFVDISALWDRPLFLLRDRALDADRDHDALVPYLRLIKAFLTHSEDDVMSILSSPSSKQSSVLPAITSVGLSCLSTLCSSKEFTCASASRMQSSLLSVCPREEIKKTILSLLHSLARVVECVRPSPSTNIEETNESERLWIRTIFCIIPMIEFLTNLRARFDFQPVFEGVGGKNFTLTDAEAKDILDSGLLRELLAMYAAAGKYSAPCGDGDTTSTPSKASDVTRRQLLRTIYALSIASPEILGQYAARVPDLAKEVQSTRFMEEYLIDAILWAALSSFILESKADSPGPRLKLRVSTKPKACDSEQERSMAERSCTGFLKLCSSAQSALGVLKDSITTSAEGGLNCEAVTMEELDRHKTALGDIISFANCLANSNNATKIWISSLNSKEDIAQQAKEKLIELRSVLSNIPSYSDNCKASCTGHKKDDEEEDTEQVLYEEDVMKRKEAKSMHERKEFGTMVASVRSSVKIISSALESQKACGLSLNGTMACNVSSKTD
eukprot:CCRYP_005334-RA/>CCRYP_005334-RA protein AED:0.34 eAED:0.34 QI:0/0/0/1/1/1/2/0/866